MMGIQDNPAHTIPLMGGMCGFHSEMFKVHFPEWPSWDKMVDGFRFNRHGADQDFLTQKIYKKIPNIVQVVTPNASNHKNKYWESDLTCRHVGSAGVVDFELLRFFQRHDSNGESINKEFERLLHHERKHLYWL